MSTAIKLGEAYILRTITMIYTGRVQSVSRHEIVLTDAAWIADTGRWAMSLATGELREVEPYPDGEVIIARAALVDAARWVHDLPREIL